MSETTLKKATEEIVRLVSERVEPKALHPFLPDSFDRLKTVICLHIGDLITEADRESRRADDGVILPKHIDRAAQFLVNRPLSRKMRMCVMVGGLLLGAAIPMFLVPSQGGELAEKPGVEKSGVEKPRGERQGVVLSGFFGTVGAFLLAWGFAKE